MAGPNQSKKENVGIELPLPAPGRPPDPNIKPRETARIQLPVREPMGKTPLPTPIPTPIPAPVAHAPDSSGLRKETARVSCMPDSLSAQMKKIDRLIAMSDVAAQIPSSDLSPGKNIAMLLILILF